MRTVVEGNVTSFQTSGFLFTRFSHFHSFQSMVRARWFMQGKVGGEGKEREGDVTLLIA